jgi:transcriptional regulator with XRE-family HTH domain
MQKMERPSAKLPRGRPKSSTKGAQEAFELVERFRKERGFSMNALAVNFGMTPSSVSRALAERAQARWTPTLRRLYYNAINNRSTGGDTLSRLSTYRGPGEEAVQRLLADVEVLIETLSHSKG